MTYEAKYKMPTSNKCGCLVFASSQKPGTYRIQLCALHGAAPELLEIAKEVAGGFASALTMNKAKQAIAKTDGGPQL